MQTHRLQAGDDQALKAGQLVKLTMAVIAINGWNRLSIAFRPEVGKYQPAAKAASSSQGA